MSIIFSARSGSQILVRSNPVQISMECRITQYQYKNIIFNNIILYIL